MEELQKRLEKLLEKVNIAAKRKQVEILQAESMDPLFWQDHLAAAEKMKELSVLQKEIEDLEYLELLVEEGSAEEAKVLLEKLEIMLFLGGPYDTQNAILSIHAGQGGTEAMDWTEMLKRMYLRYFEKKEWQSEVVDETPGDEAGLKSVTIAVNGRFAYGYLKNEQGVHRLVRQSPFNADNLRQTSFALVEVMPQIEKAEGIEVRPEEIEFEAFRSGGHGGQNVNKVSTAVRIKHIPTGIVVTCQTERSQSQNRENALKLLYARLWQKQQEEEKKEEKSLRGEYKTPGWGNQIRSYVLHPYKMVKDLRTGFETTQAEAVLDGELDGFIEEEIRYFA